MDRMKAPVAVVLLALAVSWWLPSQESADADKSTEAQLAAALKKYRLTPRSLRVWRDGQLNGTHYSYAAMVVSSERRPLDRGDIKAVTNAVRDSLQALQFQNLVHVEITFLAGGAVFDARTYTKRNARRWRSEDGSSMMLKGKIRSDVDPTYVNVNSAVTWYAHAIAFRPMESRKGKTKIEGWKRIAWWCGENLVKQTGPRRQLRYPELMK